MEKGRVFKKLKKVLIAMVATIVIVFSMPIKAKATVAEDLVDLLLKIPDGVMWMGNVFLSGRASSESSEKINLKGMHLGNADEGHIYNFYITPYDIFSNGRIRTERDATGRVYQYKVLPIFNANFFKDTSDQHLMNENMKGVKTEDGSTQTVVLTSGSKSSTGSISLSSTDPNDSADVLRPAISNVYKYLRNLAIVVMMLVLMYIGIRIIISSAATEQSKYKQMLIDWIVGLCLLFVMHYIMSFIMNVTDIIVDMLVADETQAYYIGLDELGAAEGSWGGIGEEWYEFFDDYHDINFINSHLALRAQNDAGELIQAKNDSQAWGWIVNSIGWYAKFLINPVNTTINTAADAFNGSGSQLNAKYFEYTYNWEDWEDKLRSTDTKTDYSAEGKQYVSGEGLEITQDAIYHRTYDSNGNLVIATAKDRLIHLGNAHSDWGNNGDVTLNAIITQDGDRKDGRIPWYRHVCIYRGNILEYTRTISSFGRKYVHIYDDNSSTGFTSENDSFMFSAGNAILYLALVIETIMFVFIYFKRLLQLSFLTMIAPLVAFMYPLDKVGDGKAQAFNTWFRDYLFTALLQPFHLLLYTVFITAAIELTQKNIIYALAVYAFMIPAEKYFKKILGFEKSSAASGSGLAGAAGGLLAMRGFDRLTGLGPHGRGGKGGSGNGRTRIRIPRRSAGGSGSGGAPISSGTGGSGTGGAGTAGSRRRFFGGAARTAAGGATGGAGGVFTGRRRAGNAPNASGDGQGNKQGGIFGRTIRGVASRGLTGGKYSSLRNLNNDERRRAIGGAIGGALGRGALKTAGGVAGAAVLGTGGAIVGAATALATGDASKFFQVTGTGLVAGARRGSALGGGVASGIGGLVQDAQAYRAASEQSYADRVLAEEGIKKFSDNGVMLNEDQDFLTRGVSPYKDLNGDVEKLKPYQEALDQQRVQLQDEKIADYMDKNNLTEADWEEKRRLVEKTNDEIANDLRAANEIKPDSDKLSDSELQSQIEAAQQEKEAIEKAIKVDNSEIDMEQIVSDVGKANTWGKLNEEKRRADFINFEMNQAMQKDHPNMEVPKAPQEVTDEDVAAHASTMDESKARAAAEKERDAKVESIQDKIDDVDAKYMSRIKDAQSIGDTAAADRFEKRREKERKELEKQRAEAENVALDIEAKKREMARKELEETRKKEYDEKVAQYNAVRESYRADAEARLIRVQAIQDA